LVQQLDIIDIFEFEANKQKAKEDEIRAHILGEEEHGRS
jgi:hypothetical protein